MLFKNNFRIFSWRESDHVFACSKLMDIYGIKYTDKLKHVISKHYKYPSLQSVCDCLTEYGIKNVAVSLDKADLENLPVNAIIHSGEQADEKLSILSSINGRKISLIERGRGIRSYDLEEFRNLWTGVAILTESTRNSRENGYRNNLISSIRTKLGFSAGILLLILYILYANITNEVSGVLLNVTILLQLAGVSLTALLVMKSFKSDNGIINSICRFTDSDCDKVLSDKHANILGIVSWAESGLFYFLCNLFIIAFFRGGQFQNLLFISSALSIPVIFFSLYYQWRIIKGWCLICMVVQGILLSQFVLMILYSPFENIEFIAYSSLVLLLCSVLIPFFLLAFVIPVVSKATLSIKLNAKIQTFQRNSEYFRGHLMTARKVGSSAGYSPIVVGNEHSEKIITYVTNPKCNPCKAAYKEIKDILSLFEEDIRIEIFFLIGTEFRRSKAYEISVYLINKYYRSPALFLEALDKWNTSEGRVMLEDEVKKDPMAAALYEEANLMLGNHLKWCQKHGIKFTPSVYFLNGRLNENYPIENLKYQLAQW